MATKQKANQVNLDYWVQQFQNELKDWKQGQAAYAQATQFFQANMPMAGESIEQYRQRVAGGPNIATSIYAMDKTYDSKHVLRNYGNYTGHWAEAFYNSNIAGVDSSLELPGMPDFNALGQAAGANQRTKQKGIGRHTNILGGYAKGNPTTQVSVLGGY